MEFLPFELLINIIDNIWDLETLMQLQQTNKVLYDCVKSSYSFNKLKDCYNDERWNKWYMPKSKEGKIYVIGCIKGILGIVREYGKKVDREIILKGFIDAARNGHLVVLKWLKKKFNITEQDIKLYNKYNNEAFLNAASNGHLEILKWLKETFNITKSENNEAFIWAAQNGHLKVLKWLKETYNITEQDAKIFDNYAFRLAASNGYLDGLGFFKKT
jgi:hypothetical protein